MEEKLGNLELFEEHLGCADTIADRVIGRLGQEHWVLSRVDLELVKYVSPDLLHVVPVLHYAVLHRVR